MVQRKYSEEDLFQHSTMTFGEHIEELRAALWKAVLALTLGFLIGMLLGRQVVQLLRYPIETALVSYYHGKAVERFQQQLQQQADAGDPHAKRLLAEPELRKAIEDSPQFRSGMLFEPVYVDPADLARELRRLYPGKFPDLAAPAAPADAAAERPAKAGMVQLNLWRLPDDDSRTRVTALSASEAFTIWLKASFVAGFLISCPASLYFIWQFVAAGLYPHEKRYVHIFLPFSVALFFFGALLAFFFVFKPVLAFFLSMNDWLGIPLEPRMSEWLSFVLLLPLMFGISFQLPLVMLFLERIGVFTVDSYLSKWRIAVLVIAVLSMVLSPGGDPYSMMFMLIPLVGLYFGGVLLCRWMPAVRRPDEVYD